MAIDPATLILPDVNGAVMLRLRGDARLAICHPSSRVWTIAPQLGSDWAMPTWAIVLRKAGGPVMQSWQGVPVHTQRMDTDCYGPGDGDAERGMNADLMWRTMHPVLCPARNSGASRAFILGHCRVMDILHEAEPHSIPDHDTGWIKVTASYIVIYNELPAP